MVKIITVGTANPERRLTQEDSWRNLNELKKDLTPFEKKYYKWFMLDDGIKSRYLALENLEDIFCDDQDTIIKRYQEAATDLSARSARLALDKIGLAKEKIGHVTTATCTGYLCPGLSSYITEKVGLRPDLSAFDLQGMGCGAALPALSSAAGYLHDKKGTAYSLATCTEVCSSAVYWDEDLGLILSNSIFGDGSASAILTNDPEARGMEIVDYAPLILPEKREDLRFKIQNGKLRNNLSPSVPRVAAEGVETVVNRLLSANGLAKKEIAFWAIHTGGRKVLSAIAEKLSLPPEATRYSEEVLLEFGNMSSPSVLFVLKNIMESGKFKSGDTGIMLAFGAGFSCYGMVLRSH